MTLLHRYQDGTAYSRDGIPRKDPEWRVEPPPPRVLGGEEAPSIDLPRPERLPPADLWQVIRSRRSRRQWTDALLTGEEMFLLLWAAQGITAEGPRPRRAAPSAGGLYPVETYVAVARVEGLEAGLYHWDLPDETLARLAARDDVVAEAGRACLDQDQVASAAAVFIWSAVWARGAAKYGDRALRYAYLDAGHVAENLHLAAEALELGTCMIGAFLDDEMNRLVGADGGEESVIYAACVGRHA